MVCRAAGLVAIGLFFLTPSVGLAQANAGASSADSLQDSLAGISSPDLLEAFRARAADLPSSPASQLRLGLILTRLGEVAHDRTPLDEALRQLARAADARDDWPAPWIALVQAKLALFDGGFPPKEGPYQRIGSDYLLGAGDAFMRALDADPTNMQAAELLGKTVLRQVVQPQGKLALPYLRRATAAHPTPAALLALARVSHSVGDDSAAAVVLQRFLAVGGDSGVGGIELARTFSALGRPAEAATYYQMAVRHAGSPPARRLLRADLVWIMSPSEQAAFDSLQADSVGRWITHFWGERDAKSGRSLGQRLAEHYRRLVYAFAHFRATPESNQRNPRLSWGNDPDARLREESTLKFDVLPGGAEPQRSRDTRPLAGNGSSLASPDATGSLYAQATSQSLLNAYHPDQILLDDRGVIYIRYGEPDQRATYAGPNVPANESWKYLTPSGELIFHFVGVTAPTRLQEHLVYFSPLYASRSQLDPRYEQLAFELQHGGGQVRAEMLEEERERNLEAVRIGTTTDAFPLRFAHRLDAVIQTYGVGHLSPEGAGALLTFAVRANYLTPLDHAPVRGVAYPLRFRFLIEELANGQVIERDTVRNFVTSVPLTDEQYLTGQTAVPLPPGRYLIHTVLADQTGQSGVALAPDTITVPALNGPQLTLSDLVLGYAGATQQVTLDSDQIPLDPLGVIPSGADVTVYYQAGGLRPGQRYRAELEIHRRYNPGSSERVKVSFDDQPGQSTVAYRRTISLGSLQPGEYELEVTVERPDGAKVVRRRMLNLVATPRTKSPPHR